MRLWSPSLLLAPVLSFAVTAASSQAFDPAGPSSTGSPSSSNSGNANTQPPALPTITNANGASRSGGSFGDVPGRDDPRPMVNNPAPRPPQPLNEFQRFVAATSGQTVPVFGANFFEAQAPSYAPVESVPVPADYVLGPGDELHIRGWGNVDIDYRTTIDRNGQISIPRVGTIAVAGLKASDIEGHLRTQIGRVFKGFNLNVTLGQLRSIQVFVVGQTRRPGTYTVSSLSTMVNAVFASGGPGPNGSMRRVQLRRGNAVAAELDLYDFIVSGDKSRDVPLMPGDTIVYLSAGPRVAVLGAVDTAAIFELKPVGSPLSEVLTLSGGGRAVADGRRIQLERIDPANSRAPRVVQMVEPSAASATPLRDGDVVNVFAVRPQFANAVTLRGNVAEPLRHPYTPNMRISQLIPEREALITRDYYIRKNRLVQFIDRAPTPPSTADERSTTFPDGSYAAGDSGQAGGTGMAPGSVPLARSGSSNGTGLPAGAGASSPPGTTPPPGPDAISARPDLFGPTERSTTRRPGPIELNQVVRGLVDEPNWEYATIERLDVDRVRTILLSFNLAKAVFDKDPAHDLVLQPGDVVTIFGSRDIRRPQSRGVRLVRIDGEVDRPGVYQLEPGETLRALVNRAGGITPQAYVFGTEFTRQSTRLQQRQALDDAVRRLEASAAGAGAQRAANLGSTTDVAAAARLQAAEEEALKQRLNRLRTLQPNGRIALELDPGIRLVDELPDLPLEDGDGVHIPTRPGFVFAVGAVANENALLWRPGRTVGSSLEVAGVTPDADEANIFVLRADGSVMHTRDKRGLFFGGRSFLNLPLAPGDTVVVPDLLNRETAWNAFVRGTKDWTQILANFGIGAAAIKTLRN